MRRGLLPVTACFMLPFLFACQTVKRVHYDHAGARNTITQLHSHQVFDNVVRLYNGLPIVHVDYTEVSADTTDTVGGTAGSTWARERTSGPGPSTTQTGVSKTVMTDKDGTADDSTVTENSLTTATAYQAGRTLVEKFNPSAGLAGETSSKLKILADPVVNDTPYAKDVYKAYLDYLKVPNSVVRSSVHPGPGAAIVCKRYGAWWFYVPAGNATVLAAFRKLALQTVGYRESPKPKPKLMVRVASVSFPLGEQPHNGHHYHGTVTFVTPNNAGIPNQDGHMHIVVGDLPLTIPVAKTEGLAINAKVDRLTVLYPAAFEKLVSREQFSMTAMNKTAELKLGGVSLGADHGFSGSPSLITPIFPAFTAPGAALQNYQDQQAIRRLIREQTDALDR